MPAEPVQAPSGGDRRFLRRMTLATAWGSGLDGYDLGVLSVVLLPLSAELGVAPLWAGLIGASSLLGIFVGAPIGGLLTDRFGRRRLFMIDIMLFVVLGVLQAVVAEAWQLFVVRLLLGIAIGAEYAIGAPMLAEFSPSGDRGRRVAGMLVCWYGGYLASVVAAYALLDGAGWSWRWVLATSAVPAVVVLALRRGLPESPRWLMRQGRTEAARAIVDRYLGGAAYLDREEYAAERPGRGTGNTAGWRQLFAPGLRKRTVFVCTFYVCVVTPYFAIATFTPEVFRSLGITDERASTILVNGIAFAGAVVGMLTIERIGRRQQLIGPFWIMAAALVVVGLWVTDGPPLVLVACVALFGFFNALAGNLTAVYPIEVFPTEVRATGAGIASAASRIGAAIGTFLLPLALTSIGVGPTLLIGAAICGIGAVVSQLLAPETTGQSLSRTAAGAGPAAGPAVAPT